MTVTELEEEAARIAAAQPEPSDPDDVPVEGEIVEEPSPPGTDVALVGHGDGDPVMGDLALIPTASELQNLAQMAVTFSAASIVPAPLRGKPNDILLVLLTARDLNLSVTVALRECHVIDGRVTVSPKLKLATIRSRQLGKVWPDPNNDHAEATWYAQRADDLSITYSSRYTWEMAQRAGLAGRGCTPGNHATGAACKCKNNWYAYPERMLSWRAVGYLVDDVFGEVGTGLYSPDELGAITDEDGNAVIDVNEVAPLSGMKPPPGRNRNRTSGNTTQAGPPDLAPEEIRAGFTARLGALPPPAIEVAKRIWAENHLGKVDHLPAQKVKTAEAVLAMVEKRAVSGEWGTWVGAADRAPGSPESAPDPSPATGGPEGPDDGEEGDLACSTPGCTSDVVFLDDAEVAYCDDHKPL